MPMMSCPTVDNSGAMDWHSKEYTTMCDDGNGNSPMHVVCQLHIHVADHL
jgi:hypothetical protein